jgi:hypothetical protein
VRATTNNSQNVRNVNVSFPLISSSMSFYTINVRNNKNRGNNKVAAIYWASVLSIYRVVEARDRLANQNANQVKQK